MRQNRYTFSRVNTIFFPSELLKFQASSTIAVSWGFTELYKGPMTA